MKRYTLLQSLFLGLLPMGVVFVLAESLSVGPVYIFRHFWASPFFHTLGGLTTAWSAAMIFPLFIPPRLLHLVPGWLRGFFLVCLVALVGVLWEVFEFFVGASTGLLLQPGLEDTMADLICDILGASLFWAILLLRKVRVKVGLDKGRQTRYNMRHH